MFIMFIEAIKFIQFINIMKQGKCYTCQRVSFNLMIANCNHRICFHCVKNNRNTHKCAICSVTKKISFSPLKKIDQKQKQPKQRSTKTKSIESKPRGQQSPYGLKSSRKSQIHLNSYSNYRQNETTLNNQQQKKQPIQLLCKDHQEPLTMFCKSTKQIICSVCLCVKSKYCTDILPIRGAEEYLRRQNHVQREQSRIILSQVQNCNKIIKGNMQQFQKYYSSHMRVLNQIFNALHLQIQKLQEEHKNIITQLFSTKVKECQQIQRDLTYLQDILKTYRQENKDSNTLNQQVYVYSSYKVIKKTVKELDLQYVSYANKDLNLFEFNKKLIHDSLVEMLKFRNQLPLKQSQYKKKKKSQSIRSYSKSRNQSKHQDFTELDVNQVKGLKNTRDKSGNKPRHQMSLCSNPSGLQISEDQKNLYKRLLKSRFKC